MEATPAQLQPADVQTWELLLTLGSSLLQKHETRYCIR